jgi:hypothetical protein
MSRGSGTWRLRSISTQSLPRTRDGENLVSHLKKRNDIANRLVSLLYSQVGLSQDRRGTWPENRQFRSLKILMSLP